MYLPGAAGLANAEGATVVVSAGRSSVVGGGANDRLVLLADRLRGGTPSDASPTITLAGGISGFPSSPFYPFAAQWGPQTYSFSSVTQLPGYQSEGYAVSYTFLNGGRDLGVCAFTWGAGDGNFMNGRFDPNPVTSGWSGTVVIRDYRPGDFGLSLQPANWATYDADLAALSRPALASDVVNDDPTTSWIGQANLWKYADPLSADQVQADTVALLTPPTAPTWITPTPPPVDTTPPPVIEGPEWGGGRLVGTARGERIVARGWNNTIDGGGGDDVIDAGQGGATVRLGLGAATARLNGHGNSVTGGNGAVSVSGSQDRATVVLGDGVHTVGLAGYDNDVTLGAGGGTVALGQGRLRAGDGALTVTIMGNNDQVSLGNGDNTVTGGDGGGSFIFGNGDNRLTTGGWNNAVWAGDGDNAVVAGAGGASVTLGDGDNSVTLAGWNNRVTLGAGRNTVLGGEGGDRVSVADHGWLEATTRGWDDHLVFGWGAGGVVHGRGQGLDLFVRGGADLTVELGQDAQALVTLMQGAGGYGTAWEAFGALRDDGRGGAVLSLGAGSIEFVGAAAASLSAANFRIA